MIAVWAVIAGVVTGLAVVTGGLLLVLYRVDTLNDDVERLIGRADAEDEVDVRVVPAEDPVPLPPAEPSAGAYVTCPLCRGRGTVAYQANGELAHAPCPDCEGGNVVRISSSRTGKVEPWLTAEEIRRRHEQIQELKNWAEGAL